MQKAESRMQSVLPKNLSVLILEFRIYLGFGARLSIFASGDLPGKNLPWISKAESIKQNYKIKDHRS
jgi:hypothetical protein